MAQMPSATKHTGDIALSTVKKDEVPFLDQAISFRGNEIFDQYGCAVMMNWENDLMVSFPGSCAALKQGLKK